MRPTPNSLSRCRWTLAIALICVPHTTSHAQRLAAVLDKQDPEVRAMLSEIEADAENARVTAKIPGMSIVIVHDQDVLLAKGFGYANAENRCPPIHRQSTA